MSFWWSRAGVLVPTRRLCAKTHACRNFIERVDITAPRKVISYSFDSAHWQATRFSDGTTYGLWYGSLDVATTVYETAWHW